MLPDKSRIDLFDQYLRGELSPEEKINFEQSLLSDPALNHDYHQYLQLVNSINVMSREWLKQKVKQKGKVKYWGNAWGKKWTIAYAAIFLLFVLIYFVTEQVAPLNKTNSSENVALNNETEYPEIIPSNPNQASSSDSFTPKKTPQAAIIEDLEPDILDEEDISFHVDQLNDLPHPELTSKQSAEQREKTEAPPEKKPEASPPPPHHSPADIPSTEKDQKLKPSTSTQPLDVKKSELIKDTILHIIWVWKDHEKTFKEDTHKVHIQFFTSPLNTKNYTLSHAKNSASHLMAWGLPQDHKYIKCWIIGKDLYLQLKQEHEAIFKFTPNQYYLPLQIETNKDILNLLYR
jgi:hypothetical protein